MSNPAKKQASSQNPPSSGPDAAPPPQSESPELSGGTSAVPIAIGFGVVLLIVVLLGRFAN